MYLKQSFWYIKKIQRNKKQWIATHANKRTKAKYNWYSKSKWLTGDSAKSPALEYSKRNCMSRNSSLISWSSALHITALKCPKPERQREVLNRATHGRIQWRYTEHITIQLICLTIKMVSLGWFISDHVLSSGTHQTFKRDISVFMYCVLWTVHVQLACTLNSKGTFSWIFSVNTISQKTAENANLTCCCCMMYPGCHPGYSDEDS